MKAQSIYHKLLILMSQLLYPLMSASAFFLGTIRHQGRDSSTQNSLYGSSKQGITDEILSKDTKDGKKNPIDIFGIDHVVLLVDDLEGMTEWYETVLGCKVAKHNKEFKMNHLDAGSALIDLVDKTGPLGKRSNDKKEETSDDSCQQKLDHICLALTDFDERAIKEHLASHGVKITTDTGVRYGKGGDGESLYFKDPEGTRIEVKKSRLLS